MKTKFNLQAEVAHLLECSPTKASNYILNPTFTDCTNPITNRLALSLAYWKNPAKRAQLLFALCKTSGTVKESNVFCKTILDLYAKLRGEDKDHFLSLNARVPSPASSTPLTPLVVTRKPCTPTPEPPAEELRLRSSDTPVRGHQTPVRVKLVYRTRTKLVTIPKPSLKARQLTQLRYRYSKKKRQLAALKRATSKELKNLRVHRINFL